MSSVLSGDDLSGCIIYLVLRLMLRIIGESATDSFVVFRLVADGTILRGEVLWLS